MNAFHIAALALVGAMVLAPVASRAAVPKSTREFVHKACVANQFEIETSQLALKRSDDDAVKHFAQKMIDDHHRIGERMKTTLRSIDEESLATKKLDGKHEQLLDKLKNASGKDFDRDYIAEQTKAHEEAVALFREYAKDGDNTDLRRLASETLPTLENHLKEVRKLKG